MFIIPGDTVTIDFTVQNPSTGAAADASPTPSATLVKNGTDTSITVTVTRKETGVYKATTVIPATWTSGDEVQIRVQATVGTVTGKAVVWTSTLDKTRVGALLTAPVTDLLASLADGVLPIRRGDTFSYTRSSLDFTDADKVWFTVKTAVGHTDSQAILQVNSEDGLVYINGEDAEDDTLGSVSFTDNDVTVIIDEEVTACLSVAGGLYFDIQKLTDDGDVYTLVSGNAEIVADVTRATS